MKRKKKSQTLYYRSKAPKPAEHKAPLVDENPTQPLRKELSANLRPMTAVVS